MLTVVAIMACGMLVGYLLKRQVQIISISEKLSSWAIYLLLFLLGISIGTNEQIITNLHTLGAKALIITIAAVLGSITLSWPVYHFFFIKDQNTDQTTNSPVTKKVSLNDIKGSLIILCFFSAGVLLGLLNWLPSFITQTDYSSYALYLLMFLVGTGIGSDERALKALKNFSLHIFLVPLTTIIGTLLGMCVASLLIKGISLTELMAIGSGYGYYSLSSIIISEISRPELGVIALLSNVMREITTLLCAPIFARYFGKLAPIVSGGATSMDTTLPIITASSGKEYAIVSLFHGIILTILVPFIVSFFISL